MTVSITTVAQPQESPICSPAPYVRNGAPGAPGILLLHGLTASPTEVTPIARYLQSTQPAWSLSCPLLPGHGTTPQELSRTAPDQWFAVVRSEIDRLGTFCGSLALVGVSMGALLAARAAVSEPKVRCLVMLAPVVGFRSRAMRVVRVLRLVKRYMYKSRSSLENHARKGLWSYDRYPLNSLLQLAAMSRESFDWFSSITVPTLVAFGLQDKYVPYEAVRAAVGRLARAPVEFMECPQSGHVLPHEPDSPVMLPRIASFLAAHCT